MKAFQKFASLLTVAAALSAVAPSTSHAGLIISSGNMVGAGATMFVVGGLVAGQTSGGPFCVNVIRRMGPYRTVSRSCSPTTYVKGVFETSLAVAIAGGAMIILDADTETQISNIQATLSERYRFIDNEEAIRDLAAVIQERASEKLDAAVEGETLHHLSIDAATISRVFEGVSISPEQMAIISSDLN